MRLFLLLAFNFVVFYCFAQINYPENYFSSPIDFKLNVSSNFGKIRSNHFHAGLDINTRLQSGLNIYAVADGYISRINISSTGYGKAIYITHPNGFVSVYGHLSQIDKRVANYVHQVQYQKQRFQVDLNFEKDKFPVTKGQIIGKSGNSGQSFGAHLHFEIRDEKTEEIINPFLFGFNILDINPPQINSIYLYQFIKINDQEEFLKKQKIKINKGDTLHLFGDNGFGLELRDFTTPKNGNFDPYEATMKVDDSLFFHYKFDRFSFDEAKYINSFMDYKESKISGRKIIKFFIEPNNKLSIYKTKQNGLLNFTDSAVHNVSINISDIKHNSTSLNFLIKVDTTLKIATQRKDFLNDKFIDFSKIEEFHTDSFKIVFNKDCLFDNLYFNFHVSHELGSKYSPYYFVHNQNVPLFRPATIAIKPNNLQENLKSKAIIAGVGYNHSFFSVGGKWENGFISADINTFGTYFVTVDTINPTIQQILPKTKSKSPNAIKFSSLSFKIQDDLSGIDEYVAFIDDSWVLFEYDKKNDLISCNLANENIQPGNHNLTIWVRDKCNNLTFYESTFSN